MKQTIFILESSWNYVVIFSRYNVTNEIIFLTQKVRNISFCKPQQKIHNYVPHITHSVVKNTSTAPHTPSVPGQEHIYLKYLSESSALGGGEIFHTCPDLPWGPPSLLYNGYRVFPGVKERPGRDGDPSPPSSAVAMNESYTSTPPMVRTACTEPQCLYKGALYLYFYLTFYLKLNIL
jgi:hypothetical protein